MAAVYIANPVTWLVVVVLVLLAIYLIRRL